MAFPTNPTNGQTYVNPVGTQYRYVTADNKWVIDAIAVTGNQGITGSQGLTGSIGLQGPAGTDSNATGIVNILYNNGNTPIAPFTGLIGEFEMPVRFKIYGWDTWAAAGSTGYMRTVVSNQTYANYTSKMGDTSMSGLTGPWLNRQLKNTSTTAGWAGPTGAAGDIVSIWCTYVTGMSNLTIGLKYHKF